jgi:hypothetical protein
MVHDKEFLESILKEINDNPNLSVFFNKLENDYWFQSLFLLHRLAS